MYFSLLLTLMYCTINTLILQGVQVSNDNVFEKYVSMIHSKFKNFIYWFEEIEDPRVKHLITYQMRTISLYTFLTFVFKVGSNRALSCELYKEKIGIDNFISLAQDPAISRIPDPKTVSDVMIKVNPLQIEKTGVKLTSNLLRKKSLNKLKFLGSHFLIAIDGTQQVSFDYQHCPYCLKTKHKSGKITYHHNILVAKIIFPNGITLPIATEFIENKDTASEEEKNFNKQDCEPKAAYRLIERIKKYFPQLSICLLADSLYVNQNIFKKCKENGWEYIITFKEGSAKSLFFDYEDYKKAGAGSEKKIEINKKSPIKQQIFWKNNIDYKPQKINIIECLKTEKKETTRFVFISSIIANHNNIFDLINYGGRQRWKIENQGFNEEKNGGYNLEHLFCKDWTAMKNYVYFLQLAHTMNQLFEKGIFTKKEILESFKGYKYLTSKMLRHFIEKKFLWENVETINFYFDTS